jgi:methyl-accepting chemotaxis protein
MSYRSLKRVLGETHLELKCLLLFGACALLLTCVSFWVYGSQTKKLVHRQNRHRGASIVNNILLSLHWKKLGEKGPWGPQLVDALSSTIDTEPYDWERLLAIGVKISSKGQELPVDGFEHKVLEEFARTPAPANAAEIEWREQHVPNQKQYHYYQAVRAAPGKCAACHSLIHTLVPTRRQQAVKDWDLLAVMKVRISDAPVQSDIRWNNAILWGMAIATAFALVVASYFIIRYVIAKPVKHLQGVSEAISRGEMDKRAEINTGDEFEALGTAFNKMVHSLVDSQEQIRHSTAAWTSWRSSTCSSTK